MEKLPHDYRMEKAVCTPQDCAIGCKKLVDDVKQIMPRFLAHPDAQRNMDLLAGGLEKIESLSRRRFLEKGAKSAGGVLLASPFIGTLIDYLGTMTARADKTVETGKFIFPRLMFTT